jgi:hypothetical protein
MSVIFCKASFIFNWKNFNTLWVIFFYLYINEVELFISRSLVTKSGMSDNQEKFEAPFLYGVTFYPNQGRIIRFYIRPCPNTASNYIISIILRCFMNN